MRHFKGMRYRGLFLNLGLIFCVFSYFLAPSPAHASNPEAFLSAGYLGIASSSSQIDISPGYQFNPFPSITWLQIGGELTYQKVSFRGSSASNILLSGGLTGNIGPTLPDDVFISFGFAYRSGSADGSDGSTANPNGLGYYFIAGKRFPISPSISIRPSMGIVSCGTTGLVFRPLAISYLF